MAVPGSAVLESVSALEAPAAAMSFVSCVLASKCSGGGTRKLYYDTWTCFCPPRRPGYEQTKPTRMGDVWYIWPCTP